MKAGLAFEDEVRRVAEAVWRLDPGQVQPASYEGDPLIHELDGLARLRDVTHVLMATMDTKLDKIRSDVDKLVAAARIEARRGVVVEKWLITAVQLNATHLDYAKRADVKALTLDNFRERYFDARDYIARRRRAPFGSARNPRDSSITIPEDEYVELDMTVADTTPGQRNLSYRPISLEEVVDRIGRGEIVVLQGPFGAGKSLTTWEAFKHLSGRYLNRAPGAKAPIAINLRDHWGAQFGDEILERHGRSVGFAPREDLTSAWRSGLAHLLLDGFDEIAAPVIGRPSDRSFMRQARSEAMTGVRDLVRAAPHGTGTLLSGRGHYFDDLPELIDALGLNGRDFAVVRLHEFTDEQSAVYLRAHAAVQALPDWIPRKPLLLGYLVNRNLLDEVLTIDGTHGFGHAWESFLGHVCAREAEHGRGAMDAPTIRRVLERLACIARSTASGSGPLTAPDLSEAYRAETGELAGEGVLMQLQRLPGLTPRETDAGARSFVDEDLLSALQGSAVARSVMTGGTELAEYRWVNGLDGNGRRMAGHLLLEQGFDGPSVFAVAERWARASTEQTWAAQLAADALVVSLDLFEAEDAFDARGMQLSGVELRVLDLEDRSVTSLSVADSMVGSVVLGGTGIQSSVRFATCHFGRVAGVGSEDGLPRGMFVDCTFDAFDDVSTNAAVIRLQVLPGTKVMMTILRKLYLQAGGGRKLSALRRGLPPDLERFVGPCVDILQAASIVTVYGDVAHPNRRYGARARTMLSAGNTSTDVVMKQAAGLA